MSAGQRLRTPFGEARLARYPLRRRETLRAWDAADEYLLDELAGLGLGEGTRLLILNDSFGALAVSPMNPIWRWPVRATTTSAADPVVRPSFWPPTA